MTENERLTHKRMNGIKEGYWSPRKKEELLQRLGKYEDTGMEPEEISAAIGKKLDTDMLQRMNTQIHLLKELRKARKWIPVEERLPEERVNPVSQDFYEYQVTAKFGDVKDVRHYKYGNGHWWNGPGIVDQYVVAWKENPEPYSPERRITLNAGIKIDLCKFCGGEAEILMGTDGAEIRCSRCGITTGYIKDEDGFMEHVGGDMYIRHRTPKGINRAIDVWNNNPGSN